MRQARAYIMAGLVLTVGVNASAGERSWRAMMSPGPVGNGHQNFEGSCDQCHVKFAGVPAEKCLYCHTGIADLLDSKKGFHASVAEQKCVDCHTDHHGENASLTRTTARNAFDHSRTSFPLEGGHARLDCNSCHTGPMGQMTTRSCAGCHSDPHEQALGNDCGACHVARGWPRLVVPLSAHEIPVHGGHKSLDCMDCHPGGAHLAETVACAECHRKAHGGTDAACGTCHQVEGFRPARFDHGECTCVLPEQHQTVACLKCHAGWNFVDTPVLCSGCHSDEQPHQPLGECSECHLATSWEKQGDFQHNRDARFALDGLHLTVSCDGCHGDLTDFRAAPVSCQGCHAEIGFQQHGDFGDCAGCHGTGGFDQPRFDHAATGFPLLGQHEGLDCRECHEDATTRKLGQRRIPGKVGLRAAPEPIQLVKFDRRLRMLASATALQHPTGSNVRNCVDCHDDAHDGSVGTDCASCHTPWAWQPSTFDAARHTHTQFPLEGAHANVACAQCHLQGRLKGVPAACADCHLDRHAGKLGQDCGDCHVVEASWQVPSFEHSVTGFALEGPHQEQECRACHGPEHGDAMRAATDATDCRVCHEPTHNEDLGIDCVACHDVAHGVTFASARGMEFAHDAGGFPLTRRHRSLRCGDCHVAGQARPDGRCAQCHLDPHAGGMSPECEMCHRPDRWRLTRFDHAISGWPLRGKHQVTPCSSCHVNQRWVGVNTDCFGCHALDAARAPQISAHTFGAVECQDCHGLWTWRRR